MQNKSIDETLDEFQKEIGSFQNREVSLEEIERIIEQNNLVNKDKTEEEKLDTYLLKVKESWDGLMKLETEEQRIHALGFLIFTGIVETLATLDYCAKVEESVEGIRSVPMELFDDMFADFKATQRLMLEKIDKL